MISIATPAGVEQLTNHHFYKYVTSLRFEFRGKKENAN